MITTQRKLNAPLPNRTQSGLHGTRRAIAYDRLSVLMRNLRAHQVQWADYTHCAGAAVAAVDALLCSELAFRIPPNYRLSVARDL